MLAGYTGNYGRFEIEKKYFLKSLPADLSQDFHDLHDTYLPNSHLRLRIEKSPAGEIIGRKLTQKRKTPDKDSSFSIMTSIYLSDDDLAAIGNLQGSVIEKRRHFVIKDNSRIAIDIFKGKLEGLILAEVEFQNEEARDAFVPKAEWTDVTGDTRYSCGYLATKSTQFPNQ